MDVSYVLPPKEGNGLFKFPEKWRHGGTDERVSTLDDLVRKQNSLVKVADFWVEFLRNYNLPDGIFGSAEVSFNVFPGIARQRFLPRYFGEIGYPKIIIVTDLGCSEIKSWPDKGNVRLSSSGGGLAERAVSELKKEIVPIFGERALYDYSAHNNLGIGFYNRGSELVVYPD